MESEKRRIILPLVKRHFLPSVSSHVSYRHSCTPETWRQWEPQDHTDKLIRRHTSVVNCNCYFNERTSVYPGGGHAVAQLVEALRYKPEGRGFDSRFLD